MPLLPTLEEGERIDRAFEFVPQLILGHALSERIVLLITDRAVLVSRLKRFRNVPFYFERIPRMYIRQIRVRRARMIGSLLLAALLVCLGGIGILIPVFNFLRAGGDPWEMNQAVPLKLVFVVVVGLMLPFAAHGRLAITIEHSGKRSVWKTPPLLEKERKAALQHQVAELIAAFREASIMVYDERPSMRR